LQRIRNYSLQRIRTRPASATSTAPWLIMVLTKCAARSPCQVMSVLISAAAAWPMAVWCYDQWTP
jgi:hypothetical protein